MYCVFSDGRRALSSNSLVRVRLFEARPSQTLLGKYFTINDQMELDDIRYYVYPTLPRKEAEESRRGQNVYSNLYSQAVTHPSTNRAQCCLTSVIGRELVHST